MTYLPPTKLLIYNCIRGNPGISRDEIMLAVWPNQRPDSANCVSVHLHGINLMLRGYRIVRKKRGYHLVQKNPRQ